MAAPAALAEGETVIIDANTLYVISVRKLRGDDVSYLCRSAVPDGAAIKYKCVHVSSFHNITLPHPCGQGRKNIKRPSC